MAILKNKTQSNFTMVCNNILRDKTLTMKDRGVLCTIFSFPDGWDFSLKGLSAIVPDGIDSLRASINRLDKLGYLVRRETRVHGKFATEIEVFSTSQITTDSPCGEIQYGNSDTVEPTRSNQHDKSVSEKSTQYNTYNNKNTSKNDNIKSINQSGDGSTDTQELKDIIAQNIKLDWLLDKASQLPNDETEHVHEIYDVICDMVCFPRKKVTIQGTEYPWEAVKARYLKLNHTHVSEILNKILDKDKGIKNMTNYLVSMLYNESLVGTIESDASIYDDYLKEFRGTPYSS